MLDPDIVAIIAKYHFVQFPIFEVRGNIYVRNLLSSFVAMRSCGGGSSNDYTAKHSGCGKKQMVRSYFV